MIFTGITPNGETIAYRDGKRYLWTLSFIPPLVPILSYGLYLSTGSTLTTLIPFFYIFGLIPLLDALIGEDRHNPPAEVVAAMEADLYYLTLARAAVPLLWLSFIATIAFVEHRICPGGPTCFWLSESARSTAEHCWSVTSLATSQTG